MRAIIKKLNMFRRLTDVWHFAYGFLTVFAAKVFVWAGVLMFVVYLIYQAGEEEPEYESVKDYVSFLLGVCFALLVLTSMMEKNLISLVGGTYVG